MSTPAFINSPLADGFSASEIDKFFEFETDAFTHRRRRKYRTAPTQIKCSWLLTQAKFDEFDEWYEDELIVGSGSFDFELHGVVRETVFVGDVSVDVEPGMRYRVSASMLHGISSASLNLAEIDDDPDCLLLRFSREGYTAPAHDSVEFAFDSKRYTAPSAGGCTLPKR
jgi:hypothetical protein